jgi:hypothetical protein
LQNPPVQAGEVELADSESGRIVIRADDGSYAAILLSAWVRLQKGARVTWEYSVSNYGTLTSAGGHIVHYDLALWQLDAEEARAWFASAM